jgi:DNA-directed RNA polymerase subunit beta
MKQDQSKRQDWGAKRKDIPTLDLVAVQKDSYNWFLEEGIFEALQAISPIEDFTGKNWTLEFKTHSFGEPKNTPTRAKAKGITYEMPLKLRNKRNRTSCS